MKNISLFILLLLALSENTLVAQNLQKAFGNTEDSQELYDLILDSNENIFTSGVYTHGSNFLGMVSKIDSVGNLLWNKAYLPTDASSMDAFFIHSITRDDQNNIYGFGSYLGGDPNRTGYYLLKINDLGEVIWAKFLNEESQLLSALLYVNNAIYAVLSNQIVKFSLDGVVMAAVKINLGFDITLRKGVVLSNGNIVVTGESILNNIPNVPIITFDQNLTTLNSFLYYRETLLLIYGSAIAEAAGSSLILGLSDSSVCSISTELGEIQWVKTFVAKETPTSFDSLDDIAHIVATNNLKTNFFVAMNGSYFDTNTNQVYVGMTQIDNLGNVSELKALKKIPFNSIDKYLSVSSLSLKPNSNSYYLSGRLLADYHLNYFHKGSLDEMGCGEETINFDIADTKSSLLTGVFPANLIIPTTITVSSKQFSVQDIVTDYDNRYCIDPILSIEELETAIQIFPNPTQNILNIISSESILEITVYDALGKEIPVSIISTDQIDVSVLNPGIYFLTIKYHNNKTSISKFIKK